MAIKTLHITNWYHPTSGGIRSFYLALLECANRLHRPMRLVVPGEDNRVEELGDWSRVYYVKSPRAAFFDRRYRLILPHTFLLPKEKGLRHILQIEKPDLVEVCDKYTVVWIAGALRRGWIPGVPRPALVGMSCERMDDNVAGYLTSAGAARRLAALYIRNVYVPLFDFHIAVSKYVAEELTTANPGCVDKCLVLPMGVQTEDWGPQHRDPQLRLCLQHRFSGDVNTALLLYAGRFAPEKNVNLLVDMAKKLMSFKITGLEGSHSGPSPDWRLLVAGSGPLEGWLRRQSEELEGRLCLLGHISDRQELARLLASVDAFVHPNPREPFGIGPLEAMASGTPLVAPDSGGILEYADSSAAWLSAPDAGGFARAVLEILSDPLLARIKASKARSIAERHTWRNIAPRFFATYDTLVYRRRDVRESTA